MTGSTPARAMQEDHAAPSDKDGTDGWTSFRAELDRWAALGRRAEFWWRDDDATAPGDRLARLLDLAGDAPLSLAVIPAPARESLACALERHHAAGGRVRVLQHGYAHANHAPPGEKKSEYGAHRPDAEMLAELARGRERLRALFGGLARPVLTPPWNRIAPALTGRLGEAGLAGLSAFGPRPARPVAAVVNAHLDIVDWHGGRGFAGGDRVLGAAAAHLAARRQGASDPAEPTGLLTHHRDHDEDGWAFVAAFLRAVAAHPAAEWVDPFDAIGGAA